MLNFGSVPFQQTILRSPDAKKSSFLCDSSTVPFGVGNSSLFFWGYHPNSTNRSGVCWSLGIQSPCQMMIGVSNHLLSKGFRFHYHSQKVIGSLGDDSWLYYQHALRHQEALLPGPHVAPPAHHSQFPGVCLSEEVQIQFEWPPSLTILSNLLEKKKVQGNPSCPPQSYPPQE